MSATAPGAAELWSRYLREWTFWNHVRSGAALVAATLLAIALIIGERIGKPDLQYVQFSYADEVEALVQAGLPESFAKLYVEMTRAFNERLIKYRRTPENTMPTRFEDFAGELVSAYAAA